jgi:predicted DNA repair protein MutK
MPHPNGSPPLSGLLALLDDVAAIAKVAAASVDDVATQAVKAGTKTAGVVIDDAAVTPRYVTGFSAERELPIIGQIALGSLRNKFFILLPAALLLSVFAPFLITPLLMLGGSYLCFEGAEKVWHHFRADKHDEREHAPAGGDPAHLEKERVAGAIKTDFILSAEIMTIALAAIPDRGLLIEAIILAIVAVAITALVYGGVALIVKADDVGLHMHQNASLEATRALGQGIVHAMPHFLVWLSTIGTAAMLWVGGSIVLHGMEVLGAGALSHGIEHVADSAAGLVPWGTGLLAWLVRATLDGLLGLALGLALIFPGQHLVAPLWARLTRTT